MDWSREKCLELIDIYEKYPMLWDPKHGLYYNKVKKNDIWTIIDENLGCATGEAKKKMDSILGSFRREKAKGKKSVGTGKARHEVYESKWFTFSRLTFLLDRDTPRTTIDSVEDENIETEIETDGSVQIHPTTDGNVEVLPNLQEDEETAPRNEFSPTPTPTRTLATPLRKRKRIQSKSSEPSDSSTMDEALDILKKAVANRAADGCSAYGQHVAYKLRSYTDRTRNIVQHHINNILFNADLGHYNSVITNTHPSTSATPCPPSASESQPQSTTAPLTNLTNFISDDEYRNFNEWQE